MDRKDLKPTLLLALMIFLISAPAPDRDVIMEASQNFIVPNQETSLQASDLATATSAEDQEVVGSAVSG